MFHKLKFILVYLNFDIIHYVSIHFFRLQNILIELSSSYRKNYNIDIQI